MDRRPSIAFLASIAVFSTTGFSQDSPLPAIIAPPPPSGPPPAAIPSSPRPTWLEEGNATRPAGGVMTDHPVWSNGQWAGVPTSYESACTFDGPDSNFFPGATSSQFLAGAYFNWRPGPRIPKFDYVPVSFRQGWMLSDPGMGPFGRGNFEGLIGINAATIATSYGNWLAGPSLYLRYNFLEPGSVFVPYGQGGVGFVLTDAYHEQTQRAIGQAFEFHLHYEVGMKYFVTPNMSLDFEFGFQHISNANMADRNYGVNAWGAQIGFTYYFPWGAP